MGGYPGKEITDYEITISDHSFNDPRNAIILNFGSSASLKSMVASVLNKQYKTNFILNQVSKVPLHTKTPKAYALSVWRFPLIRFSHKKAINFP